MTLEKTLQNLRFTKLSFFNISNGEVINLDILKKKQSFKYSDYEYTYYTNLGGNYNDILYANENDYYYTFDILKK
jgi:hypothetical protein